jgi:hypothetical protein
MEGKEGHHIRFITAYRPCQSGGASSVSQQHSRAMAVQHDFRNPRTAILEDLAKVIQEWKMVGDHVVLGMDTNEDVKKGEVNTIFTALGLREVILDLHKDLSPPATHNMNTQREVIDGYWATSGIQITRGGYLAFGEGCPSDHRALYFDATYSVAFGQRPTEMAAVQPKRLKAKDPRLTKKYVQQVNARMLEEGFKAQFDTFKLKATIDWNSTLEADYNKLQQENTAIRKSVESKLRKLFMGGVPWSVALQRFRDRIEIWSMLVRKKKQVRICVKRIRRFLKKFPGVEHAFTCFLDDAFVNRHQAYEEYRVARKSEAIKMLDSIALKKGTDSKQEASNLIRIERQRRQARNVKRMRGKMGNNRVTKLWYTDEDGSRIQCNTQSTMERACFAENEIRSRQTELTPPMSEPMVSELGFLGDTHPLCGGGSVV